MRSCLRLLIVAVATFGIGVPSGRAETGVDAWLRYPRIRDAAVTVQYSQLPAVVVVLGDSPVLTSARDELLRGIAGMLGRTLRVESHLPTEPAFVLGTANALASAKLAESRALAPEGFHIHVAAASSTTNSGLRTATSIRVERFVVAGGDERGVLYGVFTLLRLIGLHRSLDDVDVREQPSAPIRWVNQWDNLDGTIERGYGGHSVFFDDGHVRGDLSRAGDYARLLASLGLNGCSVNNVNADTRLITAAYRPELVRLAETFRPWGVRLVLAVDFSSPQKVGGLDTFDPLDQRVIRWWQETIDDLYKSIPDLGGIVIKADSEGRLGPSAYGRTHADAANVIARPLAAHGGLILYRGFVYDHHMDWRNLKNDRARAAYDNFHDLDGRFADNVVLQIKHGPIDFQAREPVSPLFGALEHTNEAIELQVTQEYLGQQRHLVFIVPMWKEALDFDLHAKGAGTFVKDVVAGRVSKRPTGGFVGVVNVGLDPTWMGSDLAQANLYGFGRLAWNPNLTAARIADEWTRLTFGADPRVVSTISSMQLRSWRTYERYTGPLGLQTLTDIVGPHFGPAVEASERNGWGQWHRADEQGVGMDRTVATGTGFIGQYRPAVAAMYESVATCPDDLVLFMHHLPYTHVLHSGKTVIQSIYDDHYAGAADAARYVDDWESLEGAIDETRYHAVLARLEYQAGHARVWRDAVVTWFWKTSGIADAQNRAGHHPGRIEAESMTLTGYQPEAVLPWEAASDSRAVACGAGAHACEAQTVYHGAAGWYDLAVQYFDIRDGVARFSLFVNDQRVTSWSADDTLPSTKIDAHTSTWHRVRGLALRPNDTIRIVGVPDDGDRAAIDYIEIMPRR